MTYKGFRIEENPTRKLKPFRHETINEKVVKECRTIEEAQKNIDSYGDWNVNPVERLSLAKIQLLLQNITDNGFLDLSTESVDLQGAMEELHSYLEIADQVVYGRLGLKWTGTAWINRDREDRPTIATYKAITTPDKKIIELLLSLSVTIETVTNTQNVTP